MLRSITALRGYTLEAVDGDLGSVRDVYFDASSWRARYFLVDTGTWLPGKKVLLSPLVLRGSPIWATNRIPVRLSQEEVKASPGIDLRRPISRRKEEELAKYFNWSMYWQKNPAHPQVNPNDAGFPRGPDGAADAYEAENNLRSCSEICGYQVRGTDGIAGQIDDLVVDDEQWLIRYLAVDTRSWLPSRKVLVAPAWVKGFSWSEESVDIDLTVEQIHNSPEYDPAQPVNREIETRLYDYYGRPHYWTTELPIDRSI